MYVHTSTEETYADSFSFSVSDGPHDVIRTFSVRISPVDDSIPVVISNGLKVQEGVRKIITEFDLKATDRDTKVCCFLFQTRQGKGNFLLILNFPYEVIYSSCITFSIKVDTRPSTWSEIAFIHFYKASK